MRDNTRINVKTQQYKLKLIDKQSNQNFNRLSPLVESQSTTLNSFNNNISVNDHCSRYSSQLLCLVESDSTTPKQKITKEENCMEV